MSQLHELNFLLECARGRGTSSDRARWLALVEQEGEERALERLALWLGSGPTWDDDPEDEEHPDAMLLARSAEDATFLLEHAEVLAHLGRCDECLDAFDSALAERVARHPESQSTLHRLVPWFAAAALILFLVGVFGVRAFDTDEEDLGTRHLARIERLPVRVLRSTTDEDAFAVAYRRGIEEYSAERFAEAVVALGQAMELAPNRPEARVYLGSALLLEHRAGEARDVLEPATTPEVPSPLRDEALWLLAQAYLWQNDPVSARSALELRSAEAERHTTEALEQLEQLRGR